MLSAKKYLKILFSVIFFIGALAAGYAYYFSRHYPLPITSRISFDAKLKFIRDHIDPDSVDTIIVGSSIGLNNVLGSVLEKNSTLVRHALNLSVYESTTLEAEQLTQLSDAFPHLKRIIYSAQYSDFPHTTKFKDYDPKFLIKYIRKELSPLAECKVIFDACQDLEFCIKRQRQWQSRHMRSDQFTYLGFDDSGSVPLKIYRKEKVGGRWYLPHPGIMSNESFKAVARMAKRAQEKGMHFYLAHQPYREPLIKKHKSVRNALKYFDDRVAIIMKEYNGTLIQLEKLHLSDDYHADRSHLNEKGSTIVSQEIAKVIDQTEKK